MNTKTKWIIDLAAEAVSTDANAYNTVSNSVSTAEDQLFLRLKIEN